MDRVDLEPADRLHEDQPWVPALLCRAHGNASPGDRYAWRLPGQVGQPNYANGFRLTLHEQALDGAIDY